MYQPYSNVDTNPNVRRRQRPSITPLTAPISTPDENTHESISTPEKAVKLLGGTQKKSTVKRGRAKRKATPKKSHKCRNCRASFRGTARAKYCSDNCRSAYCKRQQRKTFKKAERHLQTAVCAHCGEGYKAAHASSLYCTKKCRSAAADCRRNAAIEIWALHFGRSLTWAADCIDIAGMRRTSAALAALGYSYTTDLRAWMPGWGVEYNGQPSAALVMA